MLWAWIALLGLALPSAPALAVPVASADESSGAWLDKLFDGKPVAGSADLASASGAQAPAPVRRAAVPQDDGVLLDDLSQRSFRYFWDTADPKTGLFPDRAPADCSRPKGQVVASVAASGFGLTGYCLAAERGWVPRKEALERTRRALRFLAKDSPQKNGWFYHFVDAADGSRQWGSEVSSIDTALLLGGVLTARQYFADDPELASLASAIHDRVDFPWMLDKKSNKFSHGWTPENGFLKYTWDTYSEESLLLLLAMGSKTHPVDASVWDAIARPEVSYSSHDYVSGAAPPLPQ